MMRVHTTISEIASVELRPSHGDGTCQLWLLDAQGTDLVTMFLPDDVAQAWAYAFNAHKGKAFADAHKVRVTA